MPARKFPAAKISNEQVDGFQARESLSDMAKKIKPNQLNYSHNSSN